MKKKLLFVSLVTLLGMGAFLTSCAKEEMDQWCVCGAYNYDGQWENVTVNTSQYNASSCSEVASILTQTKGVSVTCSNN